MPQGGTEGGGEKGEPHAKSQKKKEKGTKRSRRRVAVWQMPAVGQEERGGEKDEATAPSTAETCWGTLAS